MNLNLIDFGFFLLCLCSATMVWIVSNRLWGWWIYNVIAALVGFFVPIALSGLALRINDLVLGHRPPRPTCEHGNCKWNDYHVLKFVGDDVEFICKCGKKYVRSGERFFKLHDNGQREPYKVLGPKNQWEDDQ